jgi:hypothetical protein
MSVEAESCTRGRVSVSARRMPWSAPAAQLIRVGPIVGTIASIYIGTSDCDCYVWKTAHQSASLTAIKRVRYLVVNEAGMQSNLCTLLTIILT